MKKLSKSEAQRLSPAEAKRYAEFLMQEAQAKIDAEAYTQAIAYAAQIAARDEQVKLDSLLDAKMGTVSLPTGEVVDASIVPRSVQDVGSLQRFGVKTGAR